VSSSADTARTWLRKNWWLICILLATFAVRMHWNLSAHPIGEFMYSDMNGYNGRANQILDDPWQKKEYATFFPYGTTFLLAAIKYVFGRENFTAIGTIYALMSTGIVWCMYAITRRIAPAPWVAPAVGVLGIFYYPLISITGYILSEGPSSFFMILGTLLLLRLIDDGKARDAWLLGCVVAVGAAIRPQILMSGAVFGLYWLVTRKHFPNVTWKRLLMVAIPIVVVLGFSSWRLHYHTGRTGLISENGRINQVFGRCHNKGIYSMPDGKGHGTVRFAPPPLIQLEKWSDKNPDSWMQLDPVFGADPTPMDMQGFRIDSHGCKKRKCYVEGGEVQYSGYIGDHEKQGQIIRECMRRSGVLKQMRYSLTHVVLLWGYNGMWPDHANPKPRPVDTSRRWRVMTDRWKDLHNWYLLPAALLGLLFPLFPGRFRGQAVVSLGLWGLLVVAALYIGGLRFRIPYDPIIIVLAAQAYAFVLGYLIEFVRARRRRRPKRAD
jgi:hypothetical protein